MTSRQTNKGSHGKDLGRTRGIRHMVCHEAHVVEGNIAPGADVDSLCVPLAHIVVVLFFSSVFVIQ